MRRLGWAAWRRARGTAAPIFCFHNVVADGSGPVGDTSLHIEASDFREHLSWITAHYRVIPLAELTRRLRDGADARGLAAITFDDGCAGVLRHAVPALRALGAPATVFVVSGAADAPAPFWWDRLGAAGKLDHATRERCLVEWRGDSAAILAGIGGAAAQLPPEALPAPWAELASARDHGLSFGAHTITHRNLAVLSDSELDAELATPRDLIAERLGERPELVAYPYGRRNARVLAAAARHGYRAGTGMHYGLAGPGSPAHDLPRVNVPAGIGTDALACFAAGLRLRPPQ